LFDALDTVRDCVSVYTGLIGAITPNRDAMRDAALKGHATATDLADYLVRKGVAFRDAHEIVGKAVHEAVQRGCELSDLDLDDLRNFSDAIGEDVFHVLTLEGSVEARDHIGGTAPAQVTAAVARARAAL
jgi:argininosuccinate lyase